MKSLLKKLLKKKNHEQGRRELQDSGKCSGLATGEILSPKPEGAKVGKWKASLWGVGMEGTKDRKAPVERTAFL